MSAPSAQVSAPPTNPPPRIERGAAHVLFAFDVGFAIRLDAADRLLSGSRGRAPLKPSRRSPSSVQLQTPPLRVTQPVEPLALGRYQTQPTVDTVLYDFGCVSIAYSIPLAGPLLGLRDLSHELYDHAGLRADARQRINQLLDAIRPAVSKPQVSPLFEDYVVFHIERFSEACDLGALRRSHAGALAQILRAERLELSLQETHDALAARVSYGATDLTLVDWSAALVFDPDGEDVCTVLEHANVELLELRFLDRQLDAALNEAYAALSRRRWFALGGTGHDLRRIGRLQADSALLFEGVNNALKLIGDQYLARVYRVASDRLHLAEWDTAILRKLDTLEKIYAKVSDQQATWRMEVLEWIIILLIAVSIILPFVAPGK